MIVSQTPDMHLAVQFSPVRSRIDHLIIRIDGALNRQVNEIMHHPRFQHLEASWRGLYMLVCQAADSSDVKIRLLDASWSQLVRDAEYASDFDQSHLFDMVYSHEFGMPGGEPFGLLVGDYIFPEAMKDGQDITSCLSSIATTAAAAFCPFLAGAGPGMIGLEDFAELSRISDQNLFAKDTASYRWDSLRSNEDARFIGLVAPRILMRAQYEAEECCSRDGFAFQEVLDEKGKNLLWGNGAYALAIVIIRSFIKTGWFTNIRGIGDDVTGGGELSSDELPPYDMKYETTGLSAQPPIEAHFTTIQEQKLCDLGLIPLVGCYLSSFVVFNSNQSLYTQPHYGSADTRENARLSAMLQYVLCVSRFAHYIKVIMRQKIGQGKDAVSIEREIHNWLSEYTLGNSDADTSLYAKYPLRNAIVAVSDAIGCPGMFSCKIELQPHFQIDGMSVNFQLIAQPYALKYNISSSL